MSCGVGYRCHLDLALLWLWGRPEAAALIQPLTWELPYATGAALKSHKKKTKKTKKTKNRKKKRKERLKKRLRLEMRIVVLLFPVLSFVDDRRGT